MEIFVSRDGQQFGPYTLEDVNAYLAFGQLSGDDMAWYDGAADWRPLRSIEGVSAPRSPAPPPPSPPVGSEATVANPALYSMSTIGWCSLVFTIIWGAFLVRSNWLALGRPKEAKQSLNWAWGFIALIVILQIVEATSASTTGSGPGWLFWLVWYFAGYKPQAKYVKEHYGDDYLRRSATAPVLIGLVILAVIVALIVGGTSPAGQPK